MASICSNVPVAAVVAQGMMLSTSVEHGEDDDWFTFESARPDLAEAPFQRT